MAAATLKSRHAISYADAFSAATALLRDVPLVTGDPELRTMAAAEKNLKLEWIGGQVSPVPRREGSGPGLSDGG